MQVTHFSLAGVWKKYPVQYYSLMRPCPTSLSQMLVRPAVSNAGVRCTARLNGPPPPSTWVMGTSVDEFFTYTVPALVEIPILKIH